MIFGHRNKITVIAMAVLLSMTKPATEKLPRCPNKRTALPIMVRAHQVLKRPHEERNIMLGPLQDAIRIHAGAEYICDPTYVQMGGCGCLNAWQHHCVYTDEIMEEQKRWFCLAVGCVSLGQRVTETHWVWDGQLGMWSQQLLWRVPGPAAGTQMGRQRQGTQQPRLPGARGKAGRPAEPSAASVHLLPADFWSRS